MSQRIYVAGDSIIIQSLSVTNPDTKSRNVEYKLWLDIPQNPIYSYLKGGADDSVVLPAEFSNPDVLGGPQTLATVTSTFPPRGIYNLNCRLLDADTAQEIVTDSVPFLVQ
jgi:hypothetical protein